MNNFFPNCDALAQHSRQAQSVALPLVTQEPLSLSLEQICTRLPHPS